jgi:hypothetical protein
VDKILRVYQYHLQFYSGHAIPLFQEEDMVYLHSHLLSQGFQGKKDTSELSHHKLHNPDDFTIVNVTQRTVILITMPKITWNTHGTRQSKISFLRVLLRSCCYMPQIAVLIKSFHIFAPNLITQTFR